MDPMGCEHFLQLKLDHIIISSKISGVKISKSMSETTATSYPVSVI